jgi:hypothetical protein
LLPLSFGSTISLPFYFNKTVSNIIAGISVSFPQPSVTKKLQRVFI